MSKANPYGHLVKELPNMGKYYSLEELKDPRVEKLPFSIRVLLESALRNCDEFEVTKEDVETILNWKVSSTQMKEVPFKPARVILQDFTGVPALVDLAGMRDAMKRLGGDVAKINPLVPTDLVIDHSVQVDVARESGALEANEAIEFERNGERFSFLKWGAQAFENMLIVPPGSGIVHQVNLEYLARGVFSHNGFLYPDSVVGTDSHTTMIDGLGIVGWGVGGIEAEAVMLGQPISMVLPEVVGFKLTGKLTEATTATDLVLTVTAMLRKRGVVGKFVEFFGDGCNTLSLADRATIANMSPEYGATMGFFPVDNQSMKYLEQTGRDKDVVARISQYLKAQKLFREYDGAQADPEFSGDILTLDLATVVPCISGPKRPHDRVAVTDQKKDFEACLSAKIGFKGFGLPSDALGKTSKITFEGKDYNLKHGSVVIAAITSCTNTSNPSVMLGAALVAKRAVEKGLAVAPYIKTSLSPGSGVVSKYLEMSGLLPSLEKLGFFTAGYGCMTCIGNSGDLNPVVNEAITSNDLVAAAVLSGNRNFEGRVHPLTRANYLASPPLVVAYALAGTIAIDFETEPLGKDQDGKDVFLRDIWPTQTEISSIAEKTVLPEMFQTVYSAIAKGTKRWNALSVNDDVTYKWDEKSTYIHEPPFFKKMEKTLPTIESIKDAYCLLNVGDSITTDHISPAGSIAKTSPAATYLMERGVAPKDFNSYGSRRGNDEVMARGTFANIRLLNKLASKTGPLTLHIPSGEEMSVFEAANKYMQDGNDLIIIAGKEYGSGSSRDWAAKGPLLQGVKAVIAQSYERIHRSNLVGMGILPLQFKDGEDVDKYGLTGKEQFSISIDTTRLQPGQDVEVQVKGNKSFVVKSRLDTAVEAEYFKHGGILQYVLRKLVK